MRQMASEENLMSSSSSLEGAEIVDIAIPDSSTHLSVTTVLNYCKIKILKPYLIFLSCMGFRPLLNEQQDACICWKIGNIFYTGLIIVIMLTGYIVHYMACYRRERGFYYVMESSNLTLHAEYNAVWKETCEGSTAFSFIFPNLFHFLAYLHLMFVFRNTEDEQLPILMERVFLATTNISNGFISQRKLLKTLWLFITSCLIWITVSFTITNFMMADGEIKFRWINRNSSQVGLLKTVLIISTLWHDLVQSTIISNYCLQAQLLTSYVRFMREKLLQFPVQPLEWMREIEDFKRLLNYFNDRISPSVCLLTIMDIVYALSGTLWILRLHIQHKEVSSMIGYNTSNILNVALWAVIALAPFVQAARLSNSCEVLKSVGQEVRARPYVHQDTPIVELDSVLLYTTTLKIRAKLFFIPITGTTLCFCLIILTVVVLTLGQCHYFITI